MSTSTVEIEKLKATDVGVSDDSLTVDLADGRTISVPLAWYLRLLHGSTYERSKWRFIGDGEGIHWPDLDEDLSVENLLSGKRSGESSTSFQQWLDTRAERKQT
jgi:hypothetical protein